MKILQWTPTASGDFSAGVSDQFRWDAVSAFSAGHDVVAKHTSGCVLHQMRNEVADGAIRDSYDVLFMQDADNYSPISGGPLMRMINTMVESDAVACFAAIECRTIPGKMNVEPFKPGEVCEIEKGGTGMVAINLNMIRPWYADYPGPLFAPIFTDAKQTKIKMGMDVFFSNLMRLETPHKPAHRIVADCRIPTVHVNGMQKLEFNGLAEPRSATPTPGATADPATPDEER